MRFQGASPSGLLIVGNRHTYLLSAEVVSSILVTIIYNL